MSDIPTEPVFLMHPNPQRPPRIPPQIAEGDTMERLFQALFYRIAVVYSRAIPKHVRRLGETAIFVMAIICMSLLVYLHVVFNQQPLTCLSHLHDVWPRQGVLRVELFLETPPENYDLRQSYAREYHNAYINPDPNSRSSENLPVVEIIMDTVKNDTFEESSLNMDINSSVLLSNTTSDDLSERHSFLSNESQLSERTSATVTSNDSSSSMIVEPSENKGEKSSSKSLFDFYWLKQLLIDEQPILEYSVEYGFLRLPPAARQRLNIDVVLVKLDLTNDTCFGSGLSRFLLDQFIGYQEILMSSIKQLAEKETHKGYVRNVLTNDHFRFVSASQNRRWWTYLVALCIMIIFTVSVSILLRYSHFQIFLFIIDLLRTMEQNTSVIFPAAPLLTVILALIGMEAIMSEFFNDASTAFYVILIVWIADQYDSICCHTSISKRHWVRFFYIYHFAFYAYHARYNGQYSGLALITSCCFIVHSMLYFFHHFELPFIEAQLLRIFVDQNMITRSSIGTQTTNEINIQDQSTSATASPDPDRSL